MTKEEFYKSLIGKTKEEALALLVNDPAGEASFIVDENRETIKLARIRGRVRVAMARDRKNDVWRITKVYGCG